MKPLSQIAGAWRTKGQHPMPVIGKRPCDGQGRLLVDWSTPATVDAIPLADFDGPKVTGIGIALGYGIVEVDLDDVDGRYRSALPTTRARGRAGQVRGLLYACTDAETRKFRDPVTAKMIVEIRARGCQSVMPGSLHESGQRVEWIGTDHMRVIRGAELTEIVSKMVDTVLVDRHGELELHALRRQQQADALVERPAYVDVSITDRASRYLARMDASISGAGGHDALWRAACTLVRRFALPPAAALDLLGREFNPRCKPEWSPRELQHKVEHAEHALSYPLGDLLEQPLRRAS